MAFKVLFEFSGLSMLHLTGGSSGRRLDVLLSDRGKENSPHRPRLIVPVENIGNIAALIPHKDVLGLEILIGPRGQYLCDVDLKGRQLTLPGDGGVTSDPDPDLVAGALPMPRSLDEWRPLAYLPNVRGMAPTDSKVNPAPAAARILARSGHLYAAPSPNERERFQEWDVKLRGGTRRQYLADRAVLEIEVKTSNLRLGLDLEGGQAGINLQPPEGTRNADVVVSIASHCCLSKTSGNAGPVEDLVGYEKFISGPSNLSQGIVQAPRNAYFTIGNPRCPSAVWE